MSFDFGGLAGGIAGIMGSVMGYKQQQAALQQQRAQFIQQMKYAKWVQQTTWDREDSAVQRMANDMKLAGINPLMAGGMGGSPTGSMMAQPAGVDYIGGAASMAGNLNAGIGNIGNILGGMQERALQKQQIDIDRDRADQDIKESGTRMQKLLSDMTVNDFNNLLTKADIKVKEGQEKLLHMEFKKGFAEIVKIDQEINNLKKSGKGIDIDNKIKQYQTQREKALSTLYKNANKILDRADKWLGDDPVSKIISTLKEMYGTSSQAIEKAIEEYKDKKLRPYKEKWDKMNENSEKRAARFYNRYHTDPNYMGPRDEYGKPIY